MSSAAGLRTVWWTLHRWIGWAWPCLLVPIAVSGALLVWHDQLDALIHPGALRGDRRAGDRSRSAYLASAAAAFGAGSAAGRRAFSRRRRLAGGGEGARAPRGEGAPPRIVNVYLDPPTARVLDVVDFRSSLIGFLHRFHENLTDPRIFRPRRSSAGPASAC